MSSIIQGALEIALKGIGPAAFGMSDHKKFFHAEKLQ
jgi:hypothetical protein